MKKFGAFKIELLMPLFLFSFVSSGLCQNYIKADVEFYASIENSHFYKTHPNLVSKSDYTKCEYLGQTVVLTINDIGFGYKIGDNAWKTIRLSGIREIEIKGGQRSYFEYLARIVTIDGKQVDIIVSIRRGEPLHYARYTSDPITGEEDFEKVNRFWFLARQIKRIRIIQ